MRSGGEALVIPSHATRRERARRGRVPAEDPRRARSLAPIALQSRKAAGDGAWEHRTSRRLSRRQSDRPIRCRRATIRQRARRALGRLAVLASIPVAVPTRARPAQRGRHAPCAGLTAAARCLKSVAHSRSPFPFLSCTDHRHLTFVLSHPLATVRTPSSTPRRLLRLARDPEDASCAAVTTASSANRPHLSPANHIAKSRACTWPRVCRHSNSDTLYQYSSVIDSRSIPHRSPADAASPFPRATCRRSAAHLHLRVSGVSCSKVTAPSNTVIGALPPSPASPTSTVSGSPYRGNELPLTSVPQTIGYPVRCPQQSCHSLSPTLRSQPQHKPDSLDVVLSLPIALRPNSLRYACPALTCPTSTLGRFPDSRSAS